MGFITAAEKNEEVKKQSLQRCKSQGRRSAHGHRAAAPRPPHARSSSAHSTCRGASEGPGAAETPPARAGATHRRTVTSARRAGECVTGARGRRGVCGRRAGLGARSCAVSGASGGARRRRARRSGVKVFKLAVRALLPFAFLSVPDILPRGTWQTREPGRLTLGKSWGNAPARCFLCFLTTSAPSYARSSGQRPAPDACARPERLRWGVVALVLFCFSSVNSCNLFKRL